MLRTLLEDESFNLDAFASIVNPQTEEQENLILDVPQRRFCLSRCAAMSFLLIS